MAKLHLSSFGGGVALVGSADIQRTDELQVCDSYDIGERGQLVVASDLSDVASLISTGAGNLGAWGMTLAGTAQDRYLLVVGDGWTGVFADVQVVRYNLPAGTQGALLASALNAQGCIITFAAFPFVDRLGVQQRPTLICIAPRETQNPRDGGGVYIHHDSGGGFAEDDCPIFDYLGTGSGQYNEATVGTKSKQFFPRGIASYNNHIFFWGFDNKDATKGDGPNRLMFSNVGNPFKVGNDSLFTLNTVATTAIGSPVLTAVGSIAGVVAGMLITGPGIPALTTVLSLVGGITMSANATAAAPGVAIVITNGDGTGDRVFLDTDAINIGGSGEIIRAGYPWAGKFWIATNKELHYLAGFGRESFLTNGIVGIRKSRNVCGPNAMIEGPDALLYGVSTEGLWAFDGATVEPIYRSLVDFRGKSLGWWDLIWTDATRGTAYPGKTNQDLVWMLADPETMQVWVVIPWCNAAQGYGFGNDTVIIKYHPQTGGFSRQVFLNRQLTAGVMLRRESGTPTRRFIIQAAGSGNNLRAYGLKADASVSPIMPTSLPTATFGEYAPLGPDGQGVTRRMYLTISWESAASLPIVFSATPYVDQQALAAITLSIQPAAPGAPANGDLWLDTGNTDTNLGNSVAGAIVPAAGDYILKRWVVSWGKWVTIGSGGGEKGTRATIPIAFEGVPGARIKLSLPTVSAAGRYQIEGLGLEPAGAT